jgi:LPS-assembly lipoprotein
VLLLLAGCGFQLRGQASLPPELRVTYVQSQSDIGAARRSAAIATGAGQQGVTVTRDPAQATATITILRENSGRRTVAADRFDIKRQYFWLTMPLSGDAG